MRPFEKQERETDYSAVPDRMAHDITVAADSFFNIPRCGAVLARDDTYRWGNWENGPRIRQPIGFVFFVSSLDVIFAISGGPGWFLQRR